MNKLSEEDMRYALRVLISIVTNEFPPDDDRHIIAQKYAAKYFPDETIE